MAPLPAVAPPLAADTRSDGKDPAVALLLSIGVTGVSTLTTYAAIKGQHGGLAVIGLLGMLVGPSTGRWYADDIGAGALAVRALGGGAFIDGVLRDSGDDEDDCETAAQCAAFDRQEQSDHQHAEALMISGAALWIGSTVFDVVMAYHSTKKWNSLHVVPLAPLTAATGRTAGLSLTGSF